MKKKTEEKTPLMVRLPKRLHKAVKRIATQDDRSLNKTIISLVGYGLQVRNEAVE
jgi:predicted HicB family RNase H-like nuclease